MDSCQEGFESYDLNIHFVKKCVGIIFLFFIFKCIDNCLYIAWVKNTEESFYWILVFFTEKS